MNEDYSQDDTLHLGWSQYFIWSQYSYFFNMSEDYKKDLPVKVNSLCPGCIYFMDGNPEVCNALHTPGVTECVDFVSEVDDSENQSSVNSDVERAMNFIIRIGDKINSYRCQYGEKPQAILIHYSIDRLVACYCSMLFYPHEWEDPIRTRTTVEKLFDIKVVRSRDIPEDFIGIIHED